MSWTYLFGGITLAVYMFQFKFDLAIIRKVLGITLFLEIFYLIGSFISDWPFPSPTVIFQIFITVGLGFALGVIFSKIWPLPPQKGFERIIRTILLIIPALGLGMGVQVLMQGNQPTQAIYLIFGLATWLGSGHFIRKNR